VRQPFAADDRGVRLTVRLTPNARRSSLDGIVEVGEGRTAVQVHVAAAPVEGAANQALVEYLAKALGLRKADVEIRTGKTSRIKGVHLSGDGAQIAARLEVLLAR
jgi:uncharacterized protein (TIGR00251 family)